MSPYRSKILLVLEDVCVVPQCGACHSAKFCCRNANDALVKAIQRGRHRGDYLRARGIGALSAEPATQSTHRLSPITRSEVVSNRRYTLVIRPTKLRTALKDWSCQ